MRGLKYQYALIFLLFLCTALFSLFFLRELFPEYKVFQKKYVELEEFRAALTGQDPPPFDMGVKQIVIKQGKGPEVIDRCISCHVALEIPDFSKTIEKLDDKGEIIVEPNPNYIWDIVREKLKSDESLKSLFTAHVGDRTYDMERLLQRHPLIGKETRPFEFHPLDQYGCTSCHSGNGRALTVEKAHGPIFDGEYEASFEGPKPSFLELDPKNDPAFARIFNHKPGHSLLFQTAPLLVGSLIEARCVQCHQPKDEAVSTIVDRLDRVLDLKENEDRQLLSHAQLVELVNQAPPGDIDRLTTHYARGKELYISQACYACHKIEGFARGGVGPELTEEGLKYPWFVKESMVWPQADLVSSTMPNYRLDHEELSDLMTFLLAQRGSRQHTSKVEQKIEIKEWESGKKRANEMPIAFKTIQNLEAGMTTFALEGCAACHRLKGYTSKIGVESAPGKEWFKETFKEDVGSSELVSLIEKNQEVIDKYIVETTEESSILDKLDAKDPLFLPSFYAPFKFSLRAKNDTEDPELIARWQRLVHKVMMAYYQEYGFGRIVGPRPNWTGVYRSDEWLMGHFWNPSQYVARSIMPVMPFDDTKFWQLTYMLNVLGKLNRNEVKEIWDKRGFNPEVAYNIYCAQCHGDSRIGNGPVAQWIYPIPKNLKNAQFMHSLTKERAVNSILHGVKGTPMAPWGETFEEKGLGFEPPVISKEEAEKLVDWLYQNLPGKESVKEIPKWNYKADDVIEELGVETLFDIKNNSETSPDKELFYIKKKYYTPENIEQGKKLFILHCAVCHGNEGDGAGNRSETMQDAKPRMLTNLDWLNSRDDLRILRSIKYGVNGTSMIGFGETTTPLQRVQLVTFIRSLTQDQLERKKLKSTLYKLFEGSQKAIYEALGATEDPKRTKLLLDLQDSLSKQEQLLMSMADLLIGKRGTNQNVEEFLAYVNILQKGYTYTQGKFEKKDSLYDQDKGNKFKSMISEFYESKMADIETQIQLLDSKMFSDERQGQINALSQEVQDLKKILNEFLTTFSKIQKIEIDQQAIYEQLKGP